MLAMDRDLSLEQVAQVPIQAALSTFLGAGAAAGTGQERDGPALCPQHIL